MGKWFQLSGICACRSRPGHLVEDRRYLDKLRTLFPANPDRLLPDNAIWSGQGKNRGVARLQRLDRQHGAFLLRHFVSPQGEPILVGREVT